MSEAIFYFHKAFVLCFHNFVNKRHPQISLGLALLPILVHSHLTSLHLLQVARIILFLYLFFHFYLHYDQVITIPVHVHLVNIVSGAKLASTPNILTYIRSIVSEILSHLVFNHKSEMIGSQSSFCASELMFFFAKKMEESN